MSGGFWEIWWLIVERENMYWGKKLSPLIEERGRSGTTGELTEKGVGVERPVG